MAYNVSSTQAEEFISDEEIKASLAYAEENKNNLALIHQILDRAQDKKGLSHREAILLLECPDESVKERIFSLAKMIKDAIYGNRIVLFAPLYLSNYCVNSCVYCPYHVKNRAITRKKLSQEDIKREVIALKDMGPKPLALERG